MTALSAAHHQGFHIADMHLWYPYLMQDFRGWLGNHSFWSLLVEATSKPEVEVPVLC